MLIGYARVSTSDQKLDLQRDELERVGCRRIFTDVASGAKTERPGRTEALSHARKGDIIVVWKLDRFGRSLVDLLDSVHQLQQRGVGFRSLQESIDTTTSGGRLIFHVFGALAEFERDLIRERTHAGLTSARARGRRGGRPPVLDDQQRGLLHSLANDKNNSPAVICAMLGISRTTYYRYLGKAAASATTLPTPARSPRRQRRADAAKPVRSQAAARATDQTRSKQGKGGGKRQPGAC